MLSRCLKNIRRKHVEGVQRLLQELACGEGISSSSSWTQPVRSFAKLPSEYEAFYGATKSPLRKVRAAGVPESTEAATQSDEGATPVLQAPPDRTAASQKYAAESATRWMFPWEKRQMSGERGPLTTFERLYWGVFVSAIAFLLWSKLLRGEKEADQVAESEKAEKTRKRIKAARLMVAGQTLSEEDEELLDGMTPEEIQSFVETHIGSTSDPFEGLSPEEINDLLSTSPSTPIPQLQ